MAGEVRGRRVDSLQGLHWERGQCQQLEPRAALGGDVEDIVVVAVNVPVAGDDRQPIRRNEAGKAPDQPGAASLDPLLHVGTED